MILRFPIPPGKAFFRWTWTSILLPENWVSWMSPNIWRDTVSKWTHRLRKEGNNLQRNLYCACWGCYPRLSGEGASWSRKCLWWKDCPGNLTLLNTDNVNFCKRSRPYQREASRPDYLVIKKKLRGHSGKKIVRKSRNSCTVNGGGMGAHG